MQKKQLSIPYCEEWRSVIQASEKMDGSKWRRLQMTDCPVRPHFTPLPQPQLRQHLLSLEPGQWTKRIFKCISDCVIFLLANSPICQSLSTFKRLLKTHLFTSLAYRCSACISGLLWRYRNTGLNSAGWSFIKADQNAVCVCVLASVCLSVWMLPRVTQIVTAAVHAETCHLVHTR